MDRIVNFYVRNILFIMKPFNLEHAKAGRPVVTRDGREAKIIYTNAMGDYPIVALVEYPHPSPHEESCQFREDGRYIDKDSPSDLDLFMTPVKREGWINVYPEEAVSSKRVVHPSEESAARHAAKSLIKTVRVEWEE